MHRAGVCLDFFQNIGNFFHSHVYFNMKIEDDLLRGFLL